MRRRIGSMATLALGICLGAALGVAGAADEAKDAPAKEEKKASLSDSPYENGPPPITGGFTDTWQGGKKTSGAIPSGMMGGPGGADPAKGAEDRGG